MISPRECPCCGQPGSVKVSNKVVKGGALFLTQGWVGCPKCGIYKQWTNSPDGAIKVWNRRITDAE